jgi:hypothetical protein
MKNKRTNLSVFMALAILLGGLSATGCAIWVPSDPVAPQAVQQSQTTTTTSQDVPMATTKTTTVRTTAY